MRRRLLLLATIPVLLFAIGGPAGASDHGQPPPRRPLYLALGDSVAAGVGASDPAVTGYVPLFHEILRDELVCRPSGRPGCRELTLRNLAVSGATSTTLIAEQLPVAVAELRARNHDRRPNNDVEVVTIVIGGNDVFRVVPSCTTGPTPECIALIQAALGTFQANFAQILGDLRTAAGPDTVIIAMTYYNPLPSCQLAPLASLAEVVLEGQADPPLAGLNDLIRSISATNGAVVAEAYGQLSSTELVGGADCLHPNDAGHQEIADLFATSLAATVTQAA